MNKKYTLEDTNPMSYQEFGQTMQVLIDKLKVYSQEKSIQFDVVTPILRTGGIPGSIIAIQLKITKMLPVQLKYFYNPTEIKQVSTLPKLLEDMPTAPNILICEGNTSSGETAKEAIKLIKQEYPNAKLYYATVAKVFGGDDYFDGIEEYFYGVQTNENMQAGPEQLRELNLRPKITIFPWEIAENELEDINNIN